MNVEYTVFEVKGPSADEANFRLIAITSGHSIGFRFLWVDRISNVQRSIIELEPSAKPRSILSSKQSWEKNDWTMENIQDV